MPREVMPGELVLAAPDVALTHGFYPRSLQLRISLKKHCYH